MAHKFVTPSEACRLRSRNRRNHYLNYTAVLVRLSRVTPDVLLVCFFVVVFCFGNLPAFDSDFDVRAPGIVPISKSKPNS